MNFKSIKYVLVLSLILLSASFSNAANFADITSTNLLPYPMTDSSFGAVVIDANKDGHPDIFVANDGQNRLLINNGSGVLEDKTTTNLPIDTDSSRGAAVGDIDGNGFPDIFVANSDDNVNLLANDGLNRVLINDGTGKFTDETSTWLPSQEPRFYTSGAFGDIDGDGKLDLVVSSNLLPFPPGSPDLGSPILIYRNDGTKFVDETSERLTGIKHSDYGFAYKVILADFNRDNNVDILVINNLGLSNKLLINDGTGHFTEDITGIIPSDSDSSNSAAIADIDGDGKPDYIFIANDAGQKNSLYIYNSSTKKFEDKTSTNLPVDTDNSFDAAFGDLNGDGYLDIVVANGKDSGQPNKVYFNDGTGKFTLADASFFPRGNDFSTAVLIDNFDGKPGNEVFIANAFNQQNKLYSSTEAALTINTASTLPVAKFKKPYSVQLKASGGILPYTWSLKSGKLPKGLKLNSTTGKISGRAQLRELFKFTIKVSDSSNPVQTKSKLFKLRVK